MADQGGEVQGRQRDAPERQLRGRVVDQARHDQQGRGDDGSGEGPEHRAEQFAVPAAGLREQHQVQQAHRSGRRRRRAPRRRRRLPGAASATTSSAATAASTARRTAPSSGSRMFVSHAYADHAHQSTPSRKTPRRSPPHVGSRERKPLTWVIAKTNTRSKNSSSGVTRCSRSACRSTISTVETIPRPLYRPVRLSSSWGTDPPPLGEQPRQRDRAVGHLCRTIRLRFEARPRGVSIRRRAPGPRLIDPGRHRLQSRRDGRARIHSRLRLRRCS